ncbi:hypothetical protein [Pararhodobacter sp. CCB-MM2]|uniref:hypothetical protein n=1 Tax=Pararhodobacter sp. CCB-MM2 TaxID=1786003 RepID=UPI0008352DF6|nr:hypothetical protein [Pararhodobacter sp. CCB-MM2]
MWRAPIIFTLATTLSGSMAGCSPTAAPMGAAAMGAPENAVYRGVQTQLLENDLVHFVVTMENARDASDAIAYARCAAAQYALIRDMGFARHVRTTTQRTETNEGTLWQADAVYTVSPALPRGSRTIDAEVTVADCTEQGIPTV